MALLAPVKRLVKANPFAHTYAAALRSHRPLANLSQIRRNTLFSKVISRTLVSYDRLLNTYELATRVEEEGLPGTFVECGVWRGGVGGLLGLVAQRSGRVTHLFDSFQGLPAPTGRDGKRGLETGSSRLDGALQPIGVYDASLDDVSDFLFRKLRLRPDKVLLHEGWFQETVPAAWNEVGPIALLRIDADWYESVRVCLEGLYGRTIPGGYVILDDYGSYPGCRDAFHEFAATVGLDVELHPIDAHGVWFRKPRESTALAAK